ARAHAGGRIVPRPGQRAPQRHNRGALVVGRGRIRREPVAEGESYLNQPVAKLKPATWDPERCINASGSSSSSDRGPWARTASRRTVFQAQTAACTPTSSGRGPESWPP